MEPNIYRTLMQEFARSYGFEEGAVDVSEEALKREALERAARYISVPLQVVFVDTPEQLPALASFLKKPVVAPATTNKPKTE